MTPLEAILRQVGPDLTDASLTFALVGGLAVSARTEPRFTRDADLAVAVDDETAAEGRPRGCRPSLRFIRYWTGDIVAAEPMAFLRAATMRVARTGHLVALKVLSRDDAIRPQDLVDLRALVKVASQEELALARQAIESITARGYHRGRDLSPVWNCRAHVVEGWRTLLLPQVTLSGTRCSRFIVGALPRAGRTFAVEEALRRPRDRRTPASVASERPVLDDLFKRGRRADNTLAERLDRAVSRSCRNDRATPSRRARSPRRSDSARPCHVLLSRMNGGLSRIEHTEIDVVLLQELRRPSRNASSVMRLFNRSSTPGCAVSRPIATSSLAAMRSRNRRHTLAVRSRGTPDATPTITRSKPSSLARSLRRPRTGMACGSKKLPALYSLICRAAAAPGSAVTNLPRDRAARHALVQRVLPQVAHHAVERTLAVGQEDDGGRHQAPAASGSLFLNRRVSAQGSTRFLAGRVVEDETITSRRTSDCRIRRRFCIVCITPRQTRSFPNLRSTSPPPFAVPARSG